MQDNYNNCMSHYFKKGKRGPIEVIESKGVRIPIYFSPIRGTESYQFAFYKGGTENGRERADWRPPGSVRRN